METFYFVKFDVRTRKVVCLMQKADKTLRKIEIRTNISPKKEEYFLPKKTWFERVQKETDFQKEQELAEKLGRKLPGYN